MRHGTLRRFASISRGTGFPHDFQGEADGEYPFFKVSDFNTSENSRYLRECHNWVTNDAARRLRAQPVPAGSILFPKIGAALLGNSRRITTVPSVFDNNLLAIVPHSIQVRYLHYFLSTVDAGKFVKPGPVPSLSDDAFLDLVVPVLGNSAQRRIADYLDTETARIDALIAKKSRMIEAIHERYERLVFAGIAGDLSARGEPRRDSGLRWLGTIPTSWDTPPVGADFDVQLGKMLNAEAARGSEHATYVRNTNVQWDRIDTDALATMHFDAGERQRFGLRTGDLLVCEGGEVGRAAVWPGSTEPVYFQKAIHRVRPRSGGNTRFLMYCLRAAAHREVFKIEGNQATIVHLTAEKLRVHRFPRPPAHEQSMIVEILDSHRDATRAVQDKLTRQIELLREHRQALITAAVTGELDVAGAA